MRVRSVFEFFALLAAVTLLLFAGSLFVPLGSLAQERQLIASDESGNPESFKSKGGSWIGRLLFAPWIGGQGQGSEWYSSGDSELKLRPKTAGAPPVAVPDQAVAAPTEDEEDLTSEASDTAATEELEEQSDELAEEQPAEQAQPSQVLGLASTSVEPAAAGGQNQDDILTEEQPEAAAAEAGSDDLLEDANAEAAPDAANDADQLAAATPADDDLLSGDADSNTAAEPALAEGGSDDLLAEPESGDAAAKDNQELAATGSDDLLSAEPSDNNVGTSEAKIGDEWSDSEDGEKKEALSADEEHQKLFVENKYPSANTCGVCHPKHFREWSVSQHAYAQLSPVYLSLNNKINQLSNGSNGDFCLRCHNPVGSNLGESPFASNLDRHPTSREGITCVVCHRIDRAYNKVSGRIALVEGGLTEPVFGPGGNAILKQALSEPDKFRVVTDPKEPGRKIHTEAKLFQTIQTPTFCGSCHDVTLFNGFRLEEAFSEYRVSPAAARGETCQDCHMGKVQGKASGYETGPAAVVGDVPTKDRKITSHLFSGPDYPVVHPGIFPHNQEAAAFKTMREWLQFRHKEGWGTDKFENSVPAGYKFPKAWETVDDRYDGRAILNKQFELLAFARKKRLEILRNGFAIGDVRIKRAGSSGIAFDVEVRNMTDGHNVPTGFTGERLVWLDVKVTNAQGQVVFRSGDRDPNGDVRDGHSAYVHAGQVERDAYLFSLQSIFVTQNGRGGEIEHVIPIPFPSFALPRVLPSTASLVFTGEPATERNHKKGIEPNGSRVASYKVSSGALRGSGPYKIDVKLKAQAVPVNLVTAVQDVGFDYGMSPREVGDGIIAGTEVLWQRSLTAQGG